MNPEIRRRTAWMLLGASAFVAPMAWAALPAVYTGFFSQTALGGYDPVAFFEMNKPVKGDAQFTHDYSGVHWRFVNAAHRELFAANPQAYAPQYGGYCAWAVAEGSTASGDPMFWKIIDGKLYLNYDAEVQKRWEKDIPGFIAKADKNWPSVLGR
ncbi:YHS domain-containing (seleno)protein [Hydrogenophaga sp. PAMC20947]|uniref:YHS domain-containing (seleno)protein n=1 Tax=Hydrogenophaga sp. PAMC20947 TaxID=2565558 RepID=UPI001B34BFDD|nr:YHS domain-containing (seleno)protein [Hydrogenophaga sp. PAMC20947]